MLKANLPKKVACFWHFTGDEGRAKTSATASSGLKKMTPGEIRVQKDISELDAGRVGLVEWPDRTDLTSMVLTIKPEQVHFRQQQNIGRHPPQTCCFAHLQGMWKGGIFQFSINTPAMYPHDPPKASISYGMLLRGRTQGLCRYPPIRRSCV